VVYDVETIHHRRAMYMVDTNYLNDVLNKLISIDNTYYPNSNMKDGDIGERFVKDCIKYYMWDKGFKLRKSGNRTFTISGHFRAGQGNVGGIDFRFGFEHNNIRYDCYVEAKNWEAYSYNLSPSTIQTQILDRFYNNANQPGCIWILTINRGLISQLSNRCSRHNIHIVPIDMKIVTSVLNQPSLRIIMDNFIDDFDKLMTTLTNVKLAKARIKVPLKSKLYDSEIIKGYPSSQIAKRYNTTTKNIEKRRAELKAQGVDILDMRSKTARLARFIGRLDEEDMKRRILHRMMEEEYNK
jgi:hypothetical protein